MTQDMEIQKIKLTELKEYSKNAKLHDSKQVSEIRDSIIEFGYNDPIAIDENNEIIEGHGRLQALRQINPDQEIEVIRINGLTEPQKKAYRLAHNKLNMKTGFDMNLLKEEFKAIQDADYDLDVTGFSIKEIEGAFDEKEIEHQDFTPEELDVDDSQVRMVQLFFDGPKHQSFMDMLKDLKNNYNTDNITDTVWRAVHESHTANQ